MKISDFGLSRDVYEEDSYVKRSKVPLMGYATCTCRVMGWGSGRDNKRVQALSPESREPAMSVALWSPQGPQGLTTVPFEGHLLLGEVMPALGAVAVFPLGLHGSWQLVAYPL